ncbi:MAG: 1-acyl-sn-glycerol-3-phosphate acyltransferase [Deltaproteobacteria bacterium]|nr:1-acyl-sn-glycerol-3-phosphate acyltransferase [Deltaproteobacteria bacterium]
MIGMPLIRATRHVGTGLFAALSGLGVARMAPPPDPRQAAHRLAAALGAVARAHELSVTVRGDIPRGSALIVANHVSYIDPLAILPVCPALPIAKGEVAAWPVVGAIADAFGVMFVRRESPAARVRTLRRVHALLSADVPVLNFPEGTTTPGDRVLPFWRGTFGIAQRLGVPVVPVAIAYADPALAWCNAATFLPHYLRTAARPRVEVTLTFLPAMPTRVGELPEDAAARARNAIQRVLQRPEGSRGTVLPWPATRSAG